MSAILVTHDERGLAASLHATVDGALGELREYLNATPVDYQEPLPDDAPREKIEYAADDRSQFAWEVTEVEVDTSAIERLAAEHSVRTRYHNGRLQVWEEASVVTAGGPVNMSGWRPAPETQAKMLAWLGY